MADGLLFALIGIGVILLLIPVSIRLLKSVLLEDHQPEPAPEPQFQREPQSRGHGPGDDTAS